MLLRNVFVLFLLLVTATSHSRAGNYYQLWPEYDRIADLVTRQQYVHNAQFLANASTKAVLQAASGELQGGLGGLLSQAVSIVAVAGSRASGIVLRVDKQPLKAEGYNQIIMGRTNHAVLYGAFALLLPTTLTLT